ncbi:MAG: DNA alkylation repair protein [Bacteroidales bacterium]|nr:DNA alkylation repair protein [Bacteroidales bacterium]
MNDKELHQLIHNYCIENANAENVKKFSRYFKEGKYDAYGLTTKQLQEKIRELKQNKSISLEIILKTAPLLLKSPKFEEPTLLLLLLNERKEFYTETTFTEIGHWFEFSIDNWAHADTLGMYVLPHF